MALSIKQEHHSLNVQNNQLWYNCSINVWFNIITLNLSWRRYLSCGNQSVHLHCESIPSNKLHNKLSNTRWLKYGQKYNHWSLDFRKIYDHHVVSKSLIYYVWPSCIKSYASKHVWPTQMSCACSVILPDKTGM